MNYSKQRGVTLIGWLFLLTPLAIVFYAGIRLAPVYMNYVKVTRTLDELKKDHNASASARDLRMSIEKRFNIESVTFPTARDITVRRDGQKWVVQAKYEDIAPLFANLSLLLTFDKTVEL